MFRGVDDGLLDVVVDRGFLRAHEACSHVDALGAERESGSQALAVCEAAGRDEGDLECLSGAGEKDKVGDVRLAHVAGALEAVDGQKVDAEFDGGLGVSDCGALVEDYDTGRLEKFDDGARRISCCFNHLDAFVYAHLCVLAVGRGVHGREERDVDAEGVLGHGSASSDLFAQVFGGGLSEGRELQQERQQEG